MRANRFGLPFSQFPCILTPRGGKTVKKKRFEIAHLLLSFAIHLFDALFFNSFFFFIRMLFHACFFSLFFSSFDNISANTLKPCASIKKIKLSQVIYSNVDVRSTSIGVLIEIGLRGGMKSLPTTANSCYSRSYSRSFSLSLSSLILDFFSSLCVIVMNKTLCDALGMHYTKRKVYT